MLQIKAFDAVARKNMGEKNNTAPNLHRGGAVKSDEADLAFYIFGEDLVQHDGQERGWRNSRCGQRFPDAGQVLNR